MSNISNVPMFAVSDADDADDAGLEKDVALTLIGQLLVQRGRMTQVQVENVLRIQQKSGGRFGEIAIKQRYVTANDVDDALALQYGYNSLATLGNTSLPVKITKAFDAHSPFAESIRSLRSQLIHRWFDGTPGQTTLAITSVDRGDGKSFITASLAVAFAQLGERTMVIDCDMRHPTQHEVFGVKNRYGLSGVLSGRASLEEIYTLPGVPNLSVLASGPLPPNPLELLGRPAFAHLLNGLSSRYNVVLIDTPSAQEAADAQVVAQRARGCLIVGRKDRTRSKEIAQLAGVLSNSGIEILGATFNEY